MLTFIYRDTFKKEDQKKKYQTWRQGKGKNVVFEIKYLHS